MTVLSCLCFFALVYPGRSRHSGKTGHADAERNCSYGTAYLHRHWRFLGTACAAPGTSCTTFRTHASTIHHASRQAQATRKDAKHNLSISSTFILIYT